jgi:hypothetical protein
MEENEHVENEWPGVSPSLGWGMQEVGTKSGLGTEPPRLESWAGGHSLSSLRQHQVVGSRVAWDLAQVWL